VPIVLGGILVYATSLVSISIILSAGLSFLGLGVTPPNPEWGLMLNALRQAIFVNPIVAALPGVAIVITSLCFNLLSDGLRSAMDIKCRHERADPPVCRGSRRPDAAVVDRARPQETFPGTEGGPSPLVSFPGTGPFCAWRG
jgi:hypothetical protein